MITRQEYDKESAAFKANRGQLTHGEFEAARLKLNAMFKQLQIAESVQALKTGHKIESQTFLWLCKVYGVEISESFNDLMQNSVVQVSTSGYDSYKINKKQAKQLESFILELMRALQ